LFFQFVKTRKLGGDEFSQPYLEKLEQDIDYAFGQFKAVNESKTIKSDVAGTAEGTVEGVVKGVVKSVIKGSIWASFSAAKYSTLPMCLVVIHFYRGLRGDLTEDVSGNL
jgi:hypothetical protein